jgi:hypothetical protein
MVALRTWCQVKRGGALLPQREQDRTGFGGGGAGGVMPRRSSSPAKAARRPVLSFASASTQRK